MKLLASLFLALAFLVVAPEPAAARSGTAFGWKVVDVALVRPLMLAVSVVMAGTDVAIDRATVIAGDEEARTTGRSKATAIGTKPCRPSSS